MSEKTVIRVVIQQVSKASLLVDNKDQWIHIGRGIIAYICFLKGAQEGDLARCVETILNANICFNEDWKKNTSVLELGGDVLVIPQASLAGKMKGKRLQYHSLIDKDEGANLYTKFVKLVEEHISANHTPGNKQEEQVQTETKAGVVKCGIYGNRQGLTLETPGPFTHQFEF